MEVLFAIGVLTVGILGIASVLPVATHNAAQTLKRDKAIEEVTNHVAAKIARIGEQLDSVVVVNNSQQVFNSTGQRYNEISLAGLPNSFCIDPWFVTAANNLRNDANTMPDNTRNGYDRTQFPCYDPRFNPTLSPSAPIATSVSGGWSTPRFARVALPFPGASGAPSFKAAQSSAREYDNLSIFQPKDTTFPPGLFVQTGQSGTLAKNSVSGRFSSIVMMSRSAPGSNVYQASVVTMLDRDVTIVPGGGSQAFQLQPYTAAPADAINPFDNQLTYADEVMGFVTFAPRPFIGGGGGEFVYRHSAFMSPEVSSGDWLMLARQQYAVRVPGPAPTYQPVTFTPLETRFAWYQVRSVVQAPTIVAPDVYETRVAVRGPDWVFHPSQIVIHPSLGYAPPYTSSPPPLAPTSPNPPEYNFFNTGDQNFGTIVVLMPKVVSVQQTQIAL